MGLRLPYFAAWFALFCSLAGPSHAREFLVGARAEDTQAVGRPAENNPTKYLRINTKELIDQTVAVGETVEVRFSLDDPNRVWTAEGGAQRPPLKWSVGNLPKGVKLNPDEGCLIWRPTAADVDRHTLTVSVTDGAVSDSATFTITVEESWESFFLPGMQYAAFFPNSRGTFGIFQGVSIEYVIGAWVHRTETRGPSHGRFYVKLDLLFSNEKEVSELFSYTAGLDLSFERKPKRGFLIPYFGLEVGGFYQEVVGNVFQLTPLLGVHLWSQENLWVNLSGGYLLPTEKLGELRGFRAQLGLNFALW